MHYRWTILAVGTAAMAALSALRQGMPSLAPALKGELGLSLPQVGMALAFATLVAATSWQASFALLTLCPLAGLAVLAPLRGEEEGRRAARHARLRSRPATLSVTSS